MKSIFTKYRLNGSNITKYPYGGVKYELICQMPVQWSRYLLNTSLVESIFTKDSLSEVDKVLCPQRLILTQMACYNEKVS